MDGTTEAKVTGFNPRAHEGRDSHQPHGLKKGIMFQPTRPRGARPMPYMFVTFCVLFQPTRPRGARPMFCMLVTFCVLFQPTRPRGARPHRPPIAQTGQCGFNPRAHEGRDHDSSDASGGLECFNPRAHEGRDRSALNGLALEGVSTHAPTRGATAALLTVLPWRVFQPTRPRGARPHVLHAGHVLCVVSTHAPTRGATFSSIR